jgi:exopolyphosphatase/guanosine-5'-triphosphate,3'-diphosphate pyrophosphatase
VVDIGSNSVRLVVYDGLRRSPTPVFNEKILCGLGKGVAITKTGRQRNSPRPCGIAPFSRIGQTDRREAGFAVATAAARELQMARRL